MPPFYLSTQARNSSAWSPGCCRETVDGGIDHGEDVSGGQIR